MKQFLLSAILVALVVALVFTFSPTTTYTSSHREAPLISNDPLADNCDLYAFRSPADSNKVVIVATYIPLELPEGGPNYATFGTGIRYEIHIKNRTSAGALGTATDDVTYRFTFSQVNQDPTTFFNIRLGMENLKTSYTCEKSTGGGSFTTIVSNGRVPPNWIGPRSIGGAAGLNTTYPALVTASIATATSGERIFCGPRDDPFFVDLGGIFDLGQTRSAFGTDPNSSVNARDAVAGFNTHAIIIEAPINLLSKNGDLPNPANIFDPNFVIGVWTSASRQQVTTLSTAGGPPTYSGPWVQVSRLGMPLTNEAVVPIGQKDYWNAVTPYSAAETSFVSYFSNPELALYMDDSQYGGAVPALMKLRVQSVSYPAIGVIPGYTTAGFDFRNGKDGAWAATRIPGINFTGTAFAAPIKPALVAQGQPRRVDIYPVFYFGVPNLIPYQLAITRKAGPLGAGKPFIHNFLPITQTPAGDLYGGDLLRLNMATPVTPRGTTDYANNARMGLIRAAVVGLTASPFKDTLIAQRIPHLDGFPNGRRLEDDITTIELQAVGGLVLAAVGLPFNDAVAGNYSDLASLKLVDELTYNAGPTKNDIALSNTFPYLANPHNGYSYVKQLTAGAPTTLSVDGPGLGVGVPKGFILEQNYPNPFNPSTTIKYNITQRDVVKLKVFDALGQEVTSLVNDVKEPGTYSVDWDAKGVASGVYYYRLEVGSTILPAKKAIVLK